MKINTKSLSLFLGLAAICSAAPACSMREPGGEQERSAVSGEGAVVPAGNMTTPRAAHRSTLLENGKVLISGGFRGDGPGLSSTELFDPATGKFAAGPPMAAARVGHSATRLADGTVLLAGGYNGDYLSSAEIYDPATNRFEPAGPMTIPRSGHTATLLKDGRVLVAGGIGPGWTFLSQAELFDPRTRTFAPTGTMRSARESHTATLLDDGRVLIAGGHKGRRPSVIVYSSAEMYDPALGTFASAGDMNRIRHKHDATMLSDGRVLIAGGADQRDGHGAYVSAEIYDHATHRFAVTGDMNLARYKLESTSVRLNNGKVLIAGGGERPEIFDPRTNRFSFVRGSLDTGRYFAAATLLKDGRVLVTGGYDDRDAATSQAWMYTPAK